MIIKAIFTLYFLTLIYSSSFAQADNLNGTWIITRCVSLPSLPQISVNEIKNYVGGTITINENYIYQNIYDVSDTFKNLTFKTVKKAVTEYFGNDKKYINSSKDSILIVNTGLDGYMSEFLLFNADEIGLPIDENLVYLNRVNNMNGFKRTVFSEKLNFYTDSSLKNKFNYYAVKGNTVHEIFRKNSVSFIMYVNANNKIFYGWIKAVDIR